MSRTFHRLLMLLGALGAATSLHAQYKVIGADGAVTYTDRPPVSADARVQPLRLNAGGPSPVSALPFPLQQPAARFPVTFYTSPNCSACDRGREYLRQRGIPYAEKTVTTDRDGEAWAALNYGGAVPVLRIGQQVLRNFSPDEWTADLSLAGYPASSQLPGGYNGWQATPLAGTPPPPSRRADAPAQLPPILESAPQGIRF